MLSQKIYSLFLFCLNWSKLSLLQVLVILFFYPRLQLLILVGVTMGIHRIEIENSTYENFGFRSLLILEIKSSKFSNYCNNI